MAFPITPSDDTVVEWWHGLGWFCIGVVPVSILPVGGSSVPQREEFQEILLVQHLSDMFTCQWAMAVNSNEVQMLTVIELGLEFFLGCNISALEAVSDFSSYLLFLFSHGVLFNYYQSILHYSNISLYLFILFIKLPYSNYWEVSTFQWSFDYYTHQKQHKT